MFKNIECDYCHGYGTGIVSGESWVASPFVINFGYAGHRYESDVYKCLLEKRKYIAVNVFAEESVRDLPVEELDYYIGKWTSEFTNRYYRRNVLFYARPRNYRYSYWLGEGLSAVSRFDASYYNHVHIMMYTIKNTRFVKIAASFISDPKSDCNGIHVGDVILLYKDFYNTETEFNDVMITMCADHFKHTFNLYRDDCYIRLLKHPEKVCGQYDGFLRFDSGRSEATGLYDRFSVVKTIKLGYSSFRSASNIIPGLNFE